MTTITGADQINAARAIFLKGNLKCELIGLKRHGRSAYSIVKEEFGFKGNKQKVYDQLCGYVEMMLTPPAKTHVGYMATNVNISHAMLLMGTMAMMGHARTIRIDTPYLFIN